MRSSQTGQIDESEETFEITTTLEGAVEAQIDRELEDSFPSSDPPGWVLGVDRSSAYTR